MSDDPLLNKLGLVAVEAYPDATCGNQRGPVFKIKITARD